MARTGGALAGALACWAFLAAGAAWDRLPLPGEVPQRAPPGCGTTITDRITRWRDADAPPAARLTLHVGPDGQDITWR
ncbi:hypothetical protein [Streptomyces sp.]|uniref:hypothetical protein n=1 Tax=Streptomyces sp. TaxID=1931 RepID=UPI002F3EF227